MLDRVKKEKCSIGKLDENLLWNRRFGHVNVKNLVRISNKRIVRNMLEIT